VFIYKDVFRYFSKFDRTTLSRRMLTIDPISCDCSYDPANALAGTAALRPPGTDNPVIDVGETIKPHSPEHVSAQSVSSYFSPELTNCKTLFISYLERFFKYARAVDDQMAP